MNLDRSILNLSLTEFNKAIVNNLGKEVWRKINKDIDTSCVLFKGGSEKYKKLVFNYLIDNNYIEDDV